MKSIIKLSCTAAVCALLSYNPAFALVEGEGSDSSTAYSDGYAAGVNASGSTTATEGKSKCSDPSVHKTGGKADGCTYTDADGKEQTVYFNSMKPKLPQPVNHPGGVCNGYCAGLNAR